MWQLVEEIFAGGRKLAMVTSGGGSRAVSWLLNHPGASRAMLEAQVPYAPSALEDYLALPGPHGVSAETARLMAGRAFQRAQQLSGGDVEDAVHVGMGATAALATDRRRRGEDHCWLAARNAHHYHMVELRLEKGAASRLEQEDVVSTALVHMAAHACGLEGAGAPCGPLPEWATAESFDLRASHVLERLFYSNGCDVVERPAHQDGFQSDVVREKRLIYAGSFNPFHEGHRGLALAAQTLSGRDVVLEISRANVDKPTMGYVEVARRLEALPTDFAAVVSGAATFPEKARLFPGAAFAIGYDTAIRLVDVAYYGGGSKAVEMALGELGDRDCSFLVAGRVHEGVFRQLDNMHIPKAFRGLFRAIPEALFRRDISSTHLRRGEAATDTGS